MSKYHTKAVKEYISLLNREIFAQAPSKETLRKQAREAHYPQTGLNLIDRSTGELVDYERLQPYMEKAGYLPAVAMRLLQEDLK